MKRCRHVWLDLITFETRWTAKIIGRACQKCGTEERFDA